MRPRPASRRRRWSSRISTPPRRPGFRRQRPWPQRLRRRQRRRPRRRHGDGAAVRRQRPSPAAVAAVAAAVPLRSRRRGRAATSEAAAAAAEAAAVDASVDAAADVPHGHERPAAEQDAVVLDRAGRDHRRRRGHRHDGDRQRLEDARWKRRSPAWGPTTSSSCPARPPPAA